LHTKIHEKIAIYAINLSDAVTLGGPYDGGRASAVGLQGYVIVAVGGRLAEAA